MSVPPFELLRFTGAPAGPEVAVLELEGHFDSATWRARNRARLLVEAGDRSVEMPPVATTDLPDGAWRGSYALPVALLEDASYSLAAGRLLLELPTPDLSGPGAGPATHHVRLAREANDLRRRLDEAEEARRAAEQRAAEATEALEGERTRAAEAEAARDREAEKAAAELAARERAEAEEREARAAVVEAVSTADDRVEAAQADAARAVAVAREERDRVESAAREEREQALAALRTEHERAFAAAREEAERKDAEHRRALEAAEEEATRREEDAASAERARASVTRHELRSARAELESLRRELAVRKGAEGRRPDRLHLSGDGENGTGETAAVGADEPTAPDSGDEPTIRASRRAVPDPEPAANGTGEDPTVRTPPGEALTVAAERTARVPPDDGEGFRVLTPRPARPRHRIEDEHEPEALPPGAAATGARSFEPAAAARTSDSARLLAFTALAVAIVAALLVVVLRVGLV